MAISTPQLISASARIEESVVIRAGDNAYIFAFKNHTGSPLREVEVFTVAGALAALSGPYFFNVRPEKIEILDQSFHFNSALLLTTQDQITLGADPIIRFYWNRIAGERTGNNPILYVDYNVISKQSTSQITTLPFEGRDPFVMDARNTEFPNRVYMLFVRNDNRLSIRISYDLGVTWSSAVDSCVFGTNVRFVEATFTDDPLQNIRAMLREESPGSTDDVYLIDISLEPIPTGVSGKKLYPFFRRPIRVCCDGRTDRQRLKIMYPLVRRGGGGTTSDPC